MFNPTPQQHGPTAVILAGGKGTRLAPYNTVFPKPLVPLGERPILEIIVRQLAAAGFHRIVLSVGYLAELIQAYFASAEPFTNGAEVCFVREPQPLGTVGSLSLVSGLDEPFLVMNGDILTTLDYTKLLAYHRQQGGELTIAMHNHRVKLDLGVMEVDESSRLLAFQEKPTLNYFVSMGIYVYEPSVLRYVARDEYLDFPTLVWRLLADGHKVVGYPSTDYWMDLGSHVDYAKAQEEFSSIKDQLLPRRHL